MIEPTPSDIAPLALRIQETHLDWNETKCLQYAYNLWVNAQECIDYNQAAEKKEAQPCPTYPPPPLDPPSVTHMS